MSCDECTQPVNVGFEQARQHSVSTIVFMHIIHTHKDDKVTAGSGRGRPSIATFCDRGERKPVALLAFGMRGLPLPLKQAGGQTQNPF